MKILLCLYPCAEHMKNNLVCRTLISPIRQSEIDTEDPLVLVPIFWVSRRQRNNSTSAIGEEEVGQLMDDSGLWRQRSIRRQQWWE